MRTHQRLCHSEPKKLGSGMGEKNREKLEKSGKEGENRENREKSSFFYSLGTRFSRIRRRQGARPGLNPRKTSLSWSSAGVKPGPALSSARGITGSRSCLFPSIIPDKIGLGKGIICGFHGEKRDKAGADSEPCSYLHINPGMLPNPWSFSRFFLLVSFALQAWARLNLIPGFNLDALEKGMDAAGPWKKPGSSGLWKSVDFLGFPARFQGGNLGFSQIRR